MKLALGQMTAVQGEPEANLRKMEAMIVQAADNGADLICFPELSYTGYFVRKEWLEEIAEDMEGRFISSLSALARRCQIGIVGGFAEKEAGKLYNTAVLFDRQGAVAGKARKVHLWKSEKKRFAGGSEYPVFETEFGKIAILICYDLEFPEPARIAALKGAQLILCPAAWSVPAKRRWEVDLSGNALFNLIPIVGVNYSDDLCCGLSGAAGPDGNWIARTDGQEEIILYADIDDTAALTMREKIPYYEDLGSWEMEELLKLCRKLEAEK